MNRPLALSFLLALCAAATTLLTGCGGGGDEDAANISQSTTKPVNCTATPKACT